MLEETGVVVEVVRLSGVYTNPRHVMAYDDGEVRQQFSLCFIANPVGGSLATSVETSEVVYVSVHRLNELNVHPSMRLRIEHGLDTSRTSVYVG